MADRAEVHPLLAPSVPPLPLVLPPATHIDWVIGVRSPRRQGRGGGRISQKQNRDPQMFGGVPQNLDFYWPKTTVCKYQVPSLNALYVMMRLTSDLF